LPKTDTDYYRHIVFDNSLTQDHYFYSWGQATGGSSIKEDEGRLPVDTKTFLTPPTRFVSNGNRNPEEVGRRKYELFNFRYRFSGVCGQNLYFWCYSQEPIPAADATADYGVHDSRRLAGSPSSRLQASPTHFRFQIY